MDIIKQLVYSFRGCREIYMLVPGTEEKYIYIWLRFLYVHICKLLFIDYDWYLPGLHRQVYTYLYMHIHTHTKYTNTHIHI